MRYKAQYTGIGNVQDVLNFQYKDYVKILNPKVNSTFYLNLNYNMLPLGRSKKSSRLNYS